MLVSMQLAATVFLRIALCIFGFASPPRSHSIQLVAVMLLASAQRWSFYKLVCASNTSTFNRAVCLFVFFLVLSESGCVCVCDVCVCSTMCLNVCIYFVVYVLVCEWVGTSTQRLRFVLYVRLRAHIYIYTGTRLIQFNHSVETRL